LLAVDGHESVRVHGGGAAHPRAFEHRRPEQGMKIQNVLAYEMVHLGARVRLEKIVEFKSATRAELREAAQIRYGCVEPDVEILSRSVRDLKAEVGRIAGYVPVLKTLREPLIEFVRDAGLHRTALHPGGETRLECAQAKEIMLRFAPHGSRARHHGERILQVRRRMRGAASLAGVPVLVRRAA